MSVWRLSNELSLRQAHRDDTLPFDAASLEVKIWHVLLLLLTGCESMTRWTSLGLTTRHLHIGGQFSWCRGGAAWLCRRSLSRGAIGFGLGLAGRLLTHCRIHQCIVVFVLSVFIAAQLRVGGVVNFHVRHVWNCSKCNNNNNKELQAAAVHTNN